MGWDVGRGGRGGGERYTDQWDDSMLGPAARDGGGGVFGLSGRGVDAGADAGVSWTRRRYLVGTERVGTRHQGRRSSDAAHASLPACSVRWFKCKHGSLGFQNLDMIDTCIGSIGEVRASHALQVVIGLLSIRSRRRVCIT